MMIHMLLSCYWYHKGKTFQANHNLQKIPSLQVCVVIDTTKVRLFKQITTNRSLLTLVISCYWYHKGKTFQANHNWRKYYLRKQRVVIDTTKVRLFKQITTVPPLVKRILCCYWYHKGKTFQANHNATLLPAPRYVVVIDTTKVRLFKQITTTWGSETLIHLVWLIPHR